MNAVIYYSNTNESYNIAKYISSKNNYELLNIMELKSYSFDLIYLVFPIHYQSIPALIKPIIKMINANKAVIISTYGKISYGNTLNDVKKILNAKVVGGAYVPTKHTYISEDTKFNDFNKLDPLLDKINLNEEIVFKKGRRNIFAGLMPRLRHKIGVKIKRNDKCISCNKCNEICPNITNGITNKDCIRCLKCIDNCPYNALDYKLNIFMRMYLKKKKKNDLIIY